MKIVAENGRTYEVCKELHDMLVTAKTARDADYIFDQFDTPRKDRMAIWQAT